MGARNDQTVAILLFRMKLRSISNGEDGSYSPTRDPCVVNESGGRQEEYLLVECC